MADVIPAYSFKSPRRQLFAFPPDVIRSMLENPSSHKGLLKLYQTCKYFYAKRPILIVDFIEIPGFKLHHVIRNRKNVNLSHLKVPIWVFNTIFIFGFENQRLPKLYRSSADYIYLHLSKLHFDDFILLNPKYLVEFSGYFHQVYHADLSIVPIEELLQYLPNIRKFEYFIDEKCSLESLMKLNEIKLNNKFEYLKLEIHDIDPTFDMNLFCEFVMKNSIANTKIDLYPYDESQEKLKLAFQKLDSKWKDDAHPGLFLFFDEIHYNW